MTCKCFARCEADCVCDHDWTPPAVTALRTELATLQEANLALRAERAELLAAIEAMRVAGGAAEFQRAFDEAKIIAAHKGEGEK